MRWRPLARVLVDSNLDWGQDLYRLATVVQKMHIDSVRVAYSGSCALRACGTTDDYFFFVSKSFANSP